MKSNLMNVLLITVVGFVLTSSSCKKGTPRPTATETDLVADSTFLFTKEIYFWNTQIPDYNTFNPRQYEKPGDLITTSDNIVSKIASLYSSNLDKWSFAVSTEESGQIQTGQGLDWGFFVKRAYNSLGQVKWYLTYVNNLSTAGMAGVKRGWYINKIGSDSIINNQPSIDILNNLFFGTLTSATIEFVKPDGSKQAVPLSKTVFKANAVLYSNVTTTTNNRKVGYVVFNQFFQGAYTAELKTVFDNFQAQGVNELVVDLRNNRGGSTYTQDTLANLIAPASANGRTMYQYEFNQQLQQGNFPLLKKKYNYSSNPFSLANPANTELFKKIGALNLSRVFFITTINSASASELLINNLKPVMDVQIIGDTTDGKPVGYFPIDLFDKVSFYAVSFRTINGAGSADYYKGFAPNKLVFEELKFVDWGDANDQCLAQAFYYINNGGYQAIANPGTLMRSVYSATGSKATSLDNKKFSGMFKEKQ